MIFVEKVIVFLFCMSVKKVMKSVRMFMRMEIGIGLIR